VKARVRAVSVDKVIRAVKSMALSSRKKVGEEGKGDEGKGSTDHCHEGDVEGEKAVGRSARPKEKLADAKEDDDVGM
jgi:hypothetical protein